ncbi:PHD finger protein 7-like [Bradysia coprophila]|uniref:PHD finger protein 7-like n=1 Tax=Bradysia coprophila TaxID=38358 RepID=UPI00187DCB9B|nr:PHD finger protein 7-like [Bradysia coprophila]
MVIQVTFGENGQCSICKLSDVDSLNFGEIHSNKELAVHLFCLYFSANLPQNGKDNAGIVGFELNDIRKLISKCHKKICCYCQKGSATVSCHFPNCRRMFHQVCGFKANARFEYVGQFRSFCDRHNQIEDESFEFPEISGCFICREGIDSYHPVTTVPSCCGPWFHQQCLRSYAVNAGYSFMCPMCRNKNYAAIVRPRGIYVPEYEATWEKTHDFADIERFYSNCDATECVCPGGRKFTNHKWIFQLCSCCGSYGYHKLCRPLHERNEIIVCDSCKTMVSQWEKESPQNTQTLLAGLYSQQEEDAKNELIDLTMDDISDDNVMDQCIVLDDRMDVVEITEQNGTNNSFENVSLVSNSVKSYRKKRGVNENLDEKRAREKAYRPTRDKMRNYLIGLWFRDYERFPQEPVE